MKPEWRRYAPFGLYVAILAGLISAALYYINQFVDTSVKISLGLTIAGLLAYLILDPDHIKGVFSKRQTRYGSNALIMVLASLGILVIVNYIAFDNPKRWDLTEDLENTLSSETLEILEALEEPITATAFYTSDSDLSRDRVRQLFENFRFNSNNMFEFEFVNPDEEPIRTREANISLNQTTLLQLGDKEEKIQNVTEQDLTGAIVRLLAENRVVYFLTGHGERSLDEASESSITSVKNALEEKNYTVDELNLLAVPEIPEDADLIVIAGPTFPMQSEEIELLSDFIDSGGAAIILLDTNFETEIIQTEDLLVNYLETDWQVEIGDDLIVDLFSQDNVTTFAYGGEPHEITEDMVNVSSYFPAARSIQAGEDISGVSKLVLISTAPSTTWAETNVQGWIDGVAPEAVEGEDVLGPVPIIVVAENFSNGSRIVVFGDSDFATDANFNQYGNGDLLVNSIDWATGQENLINLSPKESTPRLLIPPQINVLKRIQLISRILIPLGILVSGVVVWYLRRRQG